MRTEFVLVLAFVVACAASPSDKDVDSSYGELYDGHNDYFEFVVVTKDVPSNYRKYLKEKRGHKLLPAHIYNRMMRELETQRMSEDLPRQPAESTE
ncbi:hypothetical protein AAVH_15740 [Aphelenchoides avenae]|nr:hypothetical protein AAVH_15740 [Aphelenchus avenae]